MGYYTESVSKLREGIEKMKARRDEINSIINGNSPTELWRELNQINHRLIVEQSHVNGTFGRGIGTGEYYTREI